MIDVNRRREYNVTLKGEIKDPFDNLNFVCFGLMY